MAQRVATVRRLLGRRLRTPRRSPAGSRDPRPRIFVDVTQFVDQPRTSGIQRTLLFLARNWPDDPIAEFGFRPSKGPRYAIVPLAAFREAVEWAFGDRERRGALDKDSSRALIERLSRHVAARAEPAEIPERFDAYLLPEFTFQDRIVDTLELCADRLGSRTMAIVYDALPQTHPELFFPSAQDRSARYFRSVARLDSVAFISGHTRRVVEQRLRSAKVPNALELRLGADAFGRERQPTPPPPATFVVLGTVEPRKGHEVVLDAFEGLWRRGRDHRLVFLGRRGWVPESFVERLHRLAADGERFEWQEDASDDVLRSRIGSASGMLFVSELEGYGLPPLEALSLGCPVVVSTKLPALEGLADDGQIRLDAITPEAVSAAAEKIAYPLFNAELRRRIATLRLPAWRDAVEDLAAWVRRTTRPDEVGGALSDRRT